MIITESDNSDTLEYRLIAQSALALETVSLRLHVTALGSASEASPAELYPRIHEALEAFVPANWHLHQLARTEDATGFERVELQATARIDVDQNYNLSARARAASREGLSLSRPEVDYRLPAERISGLLAGLRGQLLQEIASQVLEYRRLTGRDWRIGSIRFGVEGELEGRRSAKGAYLQSLSEDAGKAGGGLADGEGLALIAEVQLRAGPVPASGGQ